MSDIILWKPESLEILPAAAKTPIEISKYAVQLSAKDKKQIVSAFTDGHYEMAINYLWGKSLTALKRELATVGVGLLGEMLGKPDVDENDDVDDILTTKDAIRLAEELGIVSPTDGMRLRHTHELLTHFSQLESTISDLEEIDETEALTSFKTCIKSILGRPKIEVAKKFIEFRNALEGETLKEGDQRIEMLQSSPYFFNKLTISVLLNAAKKNIGANLEHTLANMNVIVPAIWGNLRDTEKWQIGLTYAEAYADGKTTVVGGIKSVLLKVKGFDFVPENLRSDTFVKAAEAIIRAHDGFNNFYNEYAPVKNLAKLGTTIPTPALPACISALLCVVLGNHYGVALSAVPEANMILGKISQERWTYYLNNVLPSDTRILNKLKSDRPKSNWITLVEKYNFTSYDIKNKNIASLVNLSIKRETHKINKSVDKILEDYYGKNK